MGLDGTDTDSDGDQKEGKTQIALFYLKVMVLVKSFKAANSPKLEFDNYLWILDNPPIGILKGREFPIYAVRGKEEQLNCGAIRPTHLLPHFENFP